MIWFLQNNDLIEEGGRKVEKVLQLKKTTNHHFGKLIQNYKCSEDTTQASKIDKCPWFLMRLQNLVILSNLSLRSNKKLLSKYILVTVGFTFQLCQKPNHPGIVVTANSEATQEHLSLEKHSSFFKIE